ncbi:ABC transporter [Microlunatus elymi]|uniref:ABC transporter n=1 Tax=Microlunatus elymi TaxID=2596828 RepID=A0A516PWZ2_9ACTN|nr:ABC transporter [Microlunatus elymi]QDP95705.1 ABC transporter [Microlunatus elymi]
MTAIVAGAAEEAQSPFARVRGYRLVWFLVIAGCYLLVGLWLSYHRGLIMGDALSRVADARFVLFSRFPHLAAMGFVFTPLTTFLQLPLVAVLNPWPDLLAHAVPAIVVSALAMSGAVLQVAGMLRDRRMTGGWIIVLSAMLALHPMIIIYGANGMSEALFLLMMAICARFLLRWFGSDDVHDLALVGLALALGLLVRYDALAVAIACAVLVAGTSWSRARSRGARGSSAAAMDVAVVLAPISTTFLLWTGTSWLITGEALAQFSSDYGNSAIVAASGGAVGGAGFRAGFTLIEWLVLEPMIFMIVALAVVVTAVRRVPDALPALIVYGAVLGFQGLMYVRGGTFGFLRFAITVIPLAVGLVGVLRPRRGLLYSRRAGPGARLTGSVRTLSPVRRIWSWVAVAGLLLPTLLLPALIMTRPTLAPQEYAVLAGLLPSTVSPKTQLSVEQQERTFTTEREVAQYLDALRLPDGAVLTDTLYGDAIVVASDHPRQFVIPSDLDFTNVLNDPSGHHVRYVITVPNLGRGSTDAINQRFPTIYANGADIAMLDMEFPNSGTDQPTYRLYRVIN